MSLTKIVTSFIRYDEKFLILKRSDKMKSMSGLWAGVSGMIEENDTPLQRAEIEIFEEIGISKKGITLVKASPEFRVDLPQYKDQWDIFSFLFESKNSAIKLNWENSDFKWITFEELENYDTVPSLRQILLNLL